MTWPPQSKDVNPIEMVWDELDGRLKEKQPTNAQHMWDLLPDCWKIIQNHLICLTPFGLLHYSMCYFIVLISSLLFYNVENNTNKNP
jgi:hypothetical protein